MTPQLCEVCGKALITAKQRLWPWRRPDERFPSGMVFKTTWVHEACRPKDEPTQDAAA